MIREFDSADASYLAGADDFVDGPPLVNEREHLLFVADRSGVQVISNREEDDYATWRYDIEFPSQWSARIFLRGLESQSLYDMCMGGFKRIN